ncbi:RIP metalloprotease RseP [Terrarubrum flagellatum]|uniref:RIP metalloprotease RseP n=1 Tax=Terrirubrum flagellatum TaxID=2895980 RepID=UPI0031455E8C
MSTFLFTALGFLFVLAVVVIVHEFGHYIVGRWCGVEVTTFSIGFGPELFGWTDKQGTRWRVAAVPLGGYVKFLGDANAASAPDADAVAAMPAEQRARSFPEKSIGQRAAIVAAGPIANFLLAIVIFAATAYFVGSAMLAPRVAAVLPDSAAAAAGIQVGDVIESIDGQPIAGFSDIQRIVSQKAEIPLAIVVNRSGSSLQLTATPTLKTQKTPLGTQRIGMLGLQASADPADLRVRHYGPLEAIGVGASETWQIVERSGAYFAGLFAGKESIDQMAGLPRIAMVSGQAAKAGFVPLITLAAILSVSIGLVNLVPIPMLDGGHLMFYLVEWARGRPLSERIQEYGFRIGLALVLMLMLFVTWNDIVAIRAG